MSETTTTRTGMLTLMSHPGNRAYTGYGPTEHTAVPDGDAEDLVTTIRPSKYQDEQPSVTTYTMIDDRLWVATPLTVALGDVTVEGNTVYFDGVLPDDGGCAPPEFRFDTERFYRPVRHDQIPFLTVESGYQQPCRVTVRYASAHSPEFVRFAGGQPDRATYPPAPFPIVRVVRTLLEADQFPDELLERSGLSVEVHDEDWTRWWFDPVEVVGRSVEHAEDAVAKLADVFEERAQKVAAVLAGTVPDRYAPPSHSGASSGFSVDAAAVDTLIRYRTVIDLFSRPAKPVPVR